MKIKVAQNKINSVLSVVITTCDWSRHELDSIVAFGEPTVQIGGIFVKQCPECILPPPCPCDSNDFDPEAYDLYCRFELPEEEKKIRSEFPIMVSFDTEAFDDPELCAKSWSDEIVRRIVKCVKKLRQTSHDIVKEETYEI